jgi:hypothetical protein
VFVGLSCLFGVLCAFADFFCWSVPALSAIEEGLCVAYEDDVFSGMGSFLRASLAAVEFGLGFADSDYMAGGVLLYGVMAALEMVCRYPNRKLFLTCGLRFGLQMVYWFGPRFVCRFCSSLEPSVFSAMMVMEAAGLPLMWVRWRLGPGPCLRGLCDWRARMIGALPTRMHVILWHRMLHRLGLWHSRGEDVMELDNGARIWDAEPSSVGSLCLICYSELDGGDPVGSVSCGHLYHVGCIARAMEAEPFCPYCGHQAWMGVAPAVAVGG